MVQNTRKYHSQSFKWLISFTHFSMQVLDKQPEHGIYVGCNTIKPYRKTHVKCQTNSNVSCVYSYFQFVQLPLPFWANSTVTRIKRNSAILPKGHLRPYAYCIWTPKCNWHQKQSCTMTSTIFCLSVITQGCDASVTQHQKKATLNTILLNSHFFHGCGYDVAVSMSIKLPFEQNMLHEKKPTWKYAYIPIPSITIACRGITIRNAY